MSVIPRPSHLQHEIDSTTNGAPLRPGDELPYYIVAPRYTEESAGIRLLHELCHLLNQQGLEAYMIVRPVQVDAGAVCNNLVTPLFGPAVAARHAREGRRPIIIYPETVSAPPIRGGFNVRYMLHFPGFLGGPISSEVDHMTVAYSRVIARRVPSCNDVLFLPSVDPRAFHAPEPGTPRSDSYVYASKYLDVHGQELPADLLASSKLITRHRPDSLKRDDLRRLFQTAKVLHVFENTAAITEALLCGCPVVAWKNPYFDCLIGEEEHGGDGVTWDAGEEAIAAAATQTHKFAAKYRQQIAATALSLERFIARTQAGAKATTGKVDLRIEYATPVERLADLSAGAMRTLLVSVDQLGVGRTAGNVVKGLARRARARINGSP